MPDIALVVDNTAAPRKRSATRPWLKTKRQKVPPETLSAAEYRKRRLQLLHAGFRYIPIPGAGALNWYTPSAYRLATPAEKVELEIGECRAEIACSEQQISNSLAAIERHEGKLPQLRTHLAELEARRERLAEGVVEIAPAPEHRDLRSFSHLGRRR